MPTRAHPDPSRPAVTIDHRFFPHIIDRIFSFLSYPGLIVCTRVCREWREKTTPFYKHVAIFEHGDDGNNRTVVRSRDHSYPDHSAVLMDAYFQGVDHKASPPRIKDSGVVLDFTTFDGYYSTSDLPQARRPRSRWPTAFYRLLNPTIRNRDYSEFLSCCFDGDDVVRFIDYSEGVFTLGGECPDAPTALCLSINCYTNPTEPQAFLSSDFDGLRNDFNRLDTLTVVLMDCRDVTESSFASERPAIKQDDAVTARRSNLSDFGAASELLYFTVGNSAISELAVVGLDTFVAEQDYLSYLHGMRSTIAEEMARPFSSVTTAASNVPWLGPVPKFHTHDEYREMVGEERYRLLTQH